MIEHQIDPGDEGIIIFSQRCIDAWSGNCGVAQQPIPRMHDMSDAYFIPGIRSKPNVFAMENNGIALRDKAGGKYIWMKNDGTVEINASAVTITGTLTAIQWRRRHR